MTDRKPIDPPRRLTVARGRIDERDVLIVGIDHDCPLPLDALTAAEREILEAVVAGSSNAAIASARRTSVRTVDKHVANIFTKLGLRSRAQLAARLSRGQ